MASPIDYECIFEDADVKRLEDLRKVWSNPIVFGSVENPCKCITRIIHNKSMKQKNPVYGDGVRKPRQLYPYQTEFAIQNGFLPSSDDGVLSHQCGRGLRRNIHKIPKPMCIRVKHLNVEPIKTNNERKRCHRTLQTFVLRQRQMGFLKDIKCVTATMCVECDCKHDPECFWNF